MGGKMRKFIILFITALLVSSCSWFRSAPEEKTEPPSKEELDAEKAKKIKAENFVNDGITLYKEGKNREAIESWQKALALIPNDAEIYNFIGVAYHKNGNINLAVTEFKKAVVLKEDYYQAYNNLGYMQFLLNDYDNALDDFIHAIQINPDFEAAVRNKKLVEKLIQGNLSKKAFDMAEEASKSIDYEDQIVKYNEVLKIDSTYAKAHNNIAVAYYYEGKLDSAYYHLERAIKNEKNYPEAINNLGYLYKNDDKYDIAIKLFLKALTLKPRYIGALNNLGETYMLNKEFRNARRVFNTVLELEPQNVVAKMWLGVLDGKK
jgi:Flp pilus assembly protein TadD